MEYVVSSQQLDTQSMVVYYESAKHSFIVQLARKDIWKTGSHLVDSNREPICFQLTTLNQAWQKLAGPHNV